MGALGARRGFVRRLWPATWLCVFCVCLTVGAAAQVENGQGGQATSSSVLLGGDLHQGSALRVVVWTDNKARLDRQALAKLHCDYPQGTVYQATRGDSETVFLGLPAGKYDLEISAVGYLSAQKHVDITGLTENINVDVVLERDPAAVNFDAAGTADATMSPKASKETNRAVLAFKSGSLKEAQKHLELAYKLAPSSARVNFLLGYQSFQQKKLDQAQTYLAHSTTLDPHNSEALALLGRVEHMRGQYDQAIATLELAVAANSEDWLSHALLGDAYLRQKQYEKAQKHAQLALDQGKKTASSAALVLGQAEANLGHIPEAIQTLKAFLQTTPTGPSTAEVQNYISTLEQRASSSTVANAPTLMVPSSSDASDPLLEGAAEPALSVKWQPPGVDEEKPSVAAGVTCPYDQVLAGVEHNAQQLAENVGRFAAIEDLVHEKLDNLGNPTGREIQKFDYAANISQPSPGLLQVDEYRTERYGIAELPDQIVTGGFPSLALLFLPSMRVNYEINCEGLGEWHGQPAWLMHFRQRADRPSSMGRFQAGNVAYPINLKGRAWITADTFQVVRIESELVSPMRQIQFLTQHSIAEYGPVHFQKKNLDLWLPKSADVYLDIRHHRYHRRHSFDHYMLFSVDSDQKVHEAKHQSTGPGSTTPRKRRFWNA
jgi:tetratricopeptide (TPR) repeat protein